MNLTASSLLAGILVLASSAASQTSVIKYSGALNLSSEFYSVHGVTARRPANTQRGILQFNVSLFDQINLPFEAYFASGQAGFRQPFNQFGVSPRISDWLVLHAGYYSAQLSDLTFGDTRLLGAGVELSPGPFRFKALFGRSQAAVQPDSINNVTGAYKRTMWGGTIGYGADDEFHIRLNVLHALDDTSSLFVVPVGVTPSENLVTSLAFGMPIDSNLITIDAEIAGSAFSNDIRSAELASKGIGHSLYIPRLSSQVDGAATLSLGIHPASFMNLRLNTRWIGPGFVSLGYAQAPNDVFEWTIAPAFRLLEGAVSLRGSVGQRQNNLRNNRLSTTRRTIWSFGGTAQATNQLGLDVQYSNYGIRSNPKNDTLRIENISQSLVLTPRYMFEAFGAASNAMLSYSFQDSNDKNVVTSQVNRNQTQSLSAVWSLAFPSSLSLATSLLSTSSKLPSLTTSIFNASETAGYQFFDNALSTMLTLGFSVINAVAHDSQFTFSTSLIYSLQSWGSIGLTIFNNNYTSGNTVSNPSFSEVQGTLNYSLGF